MRLFTFLLIGMYTFSFSFSKRYSLFFDVYLDTETYRDCKKFDGSKDRSGILRQCVNDLKPLQELIDLQKIQVILNRNGLYHSNEFAQGKQIYMYYDQDGSPQLYELRGDDLYAFSIRPIEEGIIGSPPPPVVPNISSTEDSNILELLNKDSKWRNTVKYVKDSIREINTKNANQGEGRDDEKINKNTAESILQGLGYIQENISLTEVGRLLDPNMTAYQRRMPSPQTVFLGSNDNGETIVEILDTKNHPVYLGPYHRAKNDYPEYFTPLTTLATSPR